MALKELVTYISRRCAQKLNCGNLYELAAKYDWDSEDVLAFLRCQKAPSKRMLCARWRRNWTTGSQTWNTCSTGSAGIGRNVRIADSWCDVRHNGTSCSRGESLKAAQVVLSPGLESVRMCSFPEAHYASSMVGQLGRR